MARGRGFRERGGGEERARRPRGPAEVSGPREVLRAAADLAGMCDIPPSLTQWGPLPRQLEEGQLPATTSLHPLEPMWQAGSKTRVLLGPDGAPAPRGAEEAEHTEPPPPSFPSCCARPSAALTASYCPPHRCSRSAPGPGPPSLGAGPCLGEGSRGALPARPPASGSASFISVSPFLPSLSRAASRSALLRPPARATCRPSSPPTRGAGCTPRSTIARRPPPPPTARATR